MKKGISGSDEDHHRHHLANFEVLKAIDRSLATITKSRHESRQSKQQQRLSVSIPQGQPRSSKTKNRLQAVQAMSTPDVVESHEGAGTTTQRIEEQVLETSSQSHYNAPPSQRNGSRGSSERRSSSTSSRNNNHAGVVGTKQTTDSSFWGDHAHQDQPDRTDSNDNTNHSATNREESVDAPKPPSVAAPKEKGRPQPKSTTNDPKQQQPPAEQAKARGSSGDDAVPVVAPYPPKRIAAPLDDPIVLALELRLKERRAQEKHRNAEMARKAEVLQQQQERLREEREAREQERRDEDARKKQEQLDERLRLMKQKEEERAARVAQLHLKVDANVLDGKRSTLDIMEERKKKIAEEEQRVLEEKLKAIRQVKRGGGVDMMEDVRNHEILIAQKRAELAEHRKVHGPQHGAVSLEPIRQVDTKVMARILEEKQTAQGAAAEKKEIAKKRLEERRRYAPPPLPPIAVAVAPPASDDPTAHAMSELVSPASQQKKTPLGAHAWGHAPTGAVKKVVVSAPQPVPYRKPLQLNNGHSDERGALVPQPPNANKKSGGRAAAAPSSKRREGEGARDGDDASREEVRRTNDDAGEGSYNEPSFPEDDDDHNNYGNGGRDDDDGATRKASVSQYTRAARHSEERQTDNERTHQVHQVGEEEKNQEHSSLSVDKVHEDEYDVHPQYQTNSAPTEHRRASSGAPTRHSEHVEEIREGGGDELDDGAEDSHRSEGTHREEVEEEATHVDDVVDTGNAVLEQGDDDNEASAEQHGEAISNDNGQHHSSGADHNPPQGIEISEEQEHPQTPGDEQEPHRETDASVDVSQEAAVAPEEHDDDHDNDSHSGEPNDDETGMHEGHHISLEIVGTSFKRASHTSQPSDAEVTQQGHPPSSSSAVSDASVHTTPSAARDPEATETTDHIGSSNHLRGVDEDEEARRSAMSNRTTSHEGLEHRGTPNTGSEEITSSSSEKKERDHVVVEPTTISEISVNEDVSVVVAESSVQAPPRKTSATGPKAAAAPTKASNVPAKKK